MNSCGFDKLVAMEANHLLVLVKADADLWEDIC
jgi:hypothetical protein